MATEFRAIIRFTRTKDGRFRAQWQDELQPTKWIPADQTPSSFEISDDNWERIEQWNETYQKEPANQRGAWNAQEEAASDLGDFLSREFLTPSIRDALRQARAHAKRKAFLRLTIHVAPDCEDLWSIPWELLRLDGRYVSGKGSMITRAKEFVDFRPEVGGGSARGPREIPFVAMSGDRTSLDPKSPTWDVFTKAHQHWVPLSEDGSWDIRGPNELAAKLANLRKRLEEEGRDDDGAVYLYDGHGGTDGLELSSRPANWLAADVLAEQLADHTLLVILVSCKAAATTRGGAGVAHALMDQGVPAVGFWTPFTQQDETEFLTSVAALLPDRPIVQALEEAAKDLFADSAIQANRIVVWEPLAFADPLAPWRSPMVEPAVRTPRNPPAVNPPAAPAALPPALPLLGHGDAVPVVPAGSVAVDTPRGLVLIGIRDGRRVEIRDGSTITPDTGSETDIIRSILLTGDGSALVVQHPGRARIFELRSGSTPIAWEPSPEIERDERVIAARRVGMNVELLLVSDGPCTRLRAGRGGAFERTEVPDPPSPTGCAASTLGGFVIAGAGGRLVTAEPQRLRRRTLGDAALVDAALLDHHPLETAFVHDKPPEVLDLDGAFSRQPVHADGRQMGERRVEILAALVQRPGDRQRSLTIRRRIVVDDLRTGVPHETLSAATLTVDHPVDRVMIPRQASDNLEPTQVLLVAGEHGEIYDLDQILDETGS